MTHTDLKQITGDAAEEKLLQVHHTVMMNHIQRDWMYKFSTFNTTKDVELATN